jgi:hypothetical protein
VIGGGSQVESRSFCSFLDHPQPIGEVYGRAVRLIPIGRAARLLMISEERIQQLQKQGYIAKPAGAVRPFHSMGRAKVSSVGKHYG